MKYALLADIHSNLEAFDACIGHATRQGAERFAFIGDLVGYNADPGAVIARVRSMVEQGVAVAVRGNHDDAVARGGSRSTNVAADLAIAWTCANLAAGHVAFLAGLPLTWREGDMLFVHASAASPARWTYIADGRLAAASIAASNAGYVFSGHVHEPLLYRLDRESRAQGILPVPGQAVEVPGRHRWLSIVGSCGQPRDGNPAACYALMDVGMRRLTFHRVPYDTASAARKVRVAGLPEVLARRLESGILDLA